jgi:hypothetical protein
MNSADWAAVPNPIAFPTEDWIRRAKLSDDRDDFLVEWHRTVSLADALHHAVLRLLSDDVLEKVVSLALRLKQSR